MNYYNATICLNGHVVDKRLANAQKYCSTCGKETYSLCTNCQNPIHGVINIDGLIGSSKYNKPYYCYECGMPYPWTQKILDNAVELLSLDDELDDTSKDLIKSAIPELIVDSPTTPIAVAKYRKGISKAGLIVSDALRQLLVDVISETAKKALFSQFSTIGAILVCFTY